jgi:chromosome segregation protein
LRLESIVAKGFKSFAKSTTLEVSHGITCVVGPNGSGKSNVVDALAWVMGEQGPSSLRGSKMEDVIFAGTASAPPLGRAEVTINLENSSGELMSQFSSVAVTRVLYRNGVSEYSINGQACRLLDVQELLSDAGLGKEMHSIVGQGQLDTVLKSSPLDRRAFIEEAAGVLKYRRRREKTSRKLEAMQANLVRLQDLIAEVKRNLRPLGRQAETAQQASEISAGIRLAKSQLLALQLTHLAQKLELSSDYEAKKKSELSLLQTQLDTSRRAVSEIESELESALIDKARSRLFALESLETSARSSRAIANQKLSMVTQNNTTYQLDKLEEIQRDLEKLTLRKEELLHLFESAQDSLTEASTARDMSYRQLEELDSQIEALRLQAEVRSAAKARRESEQSSLEEALALSRETLGSQAAKLELLLTEIERLEAARLEAEVVSASSSSNLRAEYEKSRKKELESRELVDKARDELHELEKRRDYLAARHAALGQMLDTPDGPGNLMRSEIKGIDSLVADQIKVQPGYEKAVAAALGSLANAVSATTWDAAIAAISHLRENDLGRAELVVSTVVSKRQIDLPPEAKPLLSVVEGPVELEDLLGSFVVAEDLEEARTLLESLVSDEFVVVTTNGDYLSKNLVKGGSAREPSKVELISERSQISADLAHLGKEIVKADDSLNRLKKDQLKLSNEVTAKLAELQKQDAETARKAESFGRLIAQIEAAQAERVRLEGSAELLRQKIQKDSQELAAIASELEEVEPPASEFDPGERAQLLEKLEAARQAETAAQIELGAMKERLSAAAREEEALRERLQSAENEKAEWAHKLESQGRQAQDSQKVLLVSDQLLPLMERLIVSARADLRELEASRQQKANRLSELRIQISAMESRAVELGRSAQEAEMKSYELKLQQQSITERVFDELSLTPAELLAEVETQENQEQITVDELRKTIRSSEKRLAQLGAFNPLALEEFAALEERHKYLTEQLADLNSARADLKGIIKDLDEKMNTTFLAAFEDTQKAFEEIFPILFPGGTGSISLTQPEEGQDAGVEVSVRPAGKRIERMSLLSGGERSLAAIALLIAIFKARPSPFYVLDEVEAALDDANLGRLLEVLETLRETSQLIIVTHQKRTMEIADALHGVSMGKDGITRVVGQKLDKAS